jgi:hypothetical protein
MAEHNIDVGIVVAKRKLGSPWSDHEWLPHAVLPAAPAVAPGTPLGSLPSGALLFYAGALTLTLHSSLTANYRDNLLSERSSLWVCLQTVPGSSSVPSRITADPYEGEALTEAIGSVVDALPMPQEIERMVAIFSQAHYVERPHFKRNRDSADLDALGHRPLAARRPDGRR